MIRDMQTFRIITIGNSFAINALTYLEDLAADSAEVRFEIGQANLGGCSFLKHWNLARLSERHPECKPYVLRTGPGGTPVAVTLQEALANLRWDVVTLQQASRWSWRTATFQPHLGLLHELVRRLAPQAEVLLHQTWAYRSDSPFLPQNGLDQERMFAGIRAAYERFAAELGCRLLPSGEAIQIARRTPGRRFTWPDPAFDFAAAEPPALPRQDHSLAVGWTWQITANPDGIPELNLDAGHLNSRGCYLASCSWFETLTGIDVRSLSFRPAEIDPETAAFLRECAHAACALQSPAHSNH